MRISVERLRMGLLVGASLLVVVIAAFLGYARWRLRHGISNLPGRLGATITRESNGYTYSQSDGKNTVFTIHAAKAVEHADGKYTLHDVNMILYGHKGDRADSISGSEFEYDTKAEVIRAVGLVHIDLAAPVAVGARAGEASKHLGATGVPAGAGEEAGAGSRVVHVTTSGLVYARKLATAATDQGLEFAFGGFTGHAVGAEYNSDSGHLVLQSSVTVGGIDRGRPIALAASHGELDRGSNQADFNHARYSSSDEVARAELAHLYLRADGTIDRIEGVGEVTLEDATQGRATADRADVSLDAANKPKTMVLTGNVKFNDDEAFRQARGDSRTANLEFDEDGRIKHAVLRGGAHVYESVRSADDVSAPWSERTLTADAVDLVFGAPEATGKAQLREAAAMGSTRLQSVSTVIAGTAGKKAGTTISNMASDQLQAHFVDVQGKAELSTVHGAGHTVLEQNAPGGVVQTSRGETLDLRFHEISRGKTSVEIADVVQEGGVVIDRTTSAKNAGAVAAPETQHAIARRVSYAADTDKLTLTDDVQMSDQTSRIWAAKVVMDRGSGDATAEGGVKMTYLQIGERSSVHILAARAVLNHDAGEATFYGRAGNESGANAGLARMWQASQSDQRGSGKNSGQASAQIEAPVLVFEQESKQLTARPEKAGTTGTVHTLLTRVVSPGTSGADPGRQTSTGSVAKTGASAGPTAVQGSGREVPVRITSSEMVYSDEQRQAVFSGGVRLVDSDGEMRAQEATIFLTPLDAKARKTADSMTKPADSSQGIFGGQVERIVATRRIELTQPGRLATGDRLVYTAIDRSFMLTGTGTASPKVVDDSHATTTGAMLQFRSGDHSVSVLGNDGVVPARRVRTETHTDAQPGTKVKSH